MMSKEVRDKNRQDGYYNGQQTLEDFGIVSFSRRRVSNNRLRSITELRPNHREIIRLASTGMRGSDIARSLGISDATVSCILNSTLGRAELIRLQEKRDDTVEEITLKQVTDMLTRLLPTAVDVLEDGMTGEAPISKEQIRCAETVLKHVGPPPTRREERVSAFITSEDILKIQERAAQRARAAGSLVLDVEPQNA